MKDIIEIHRRLCREYGCPVPYFHETDPLSELVSSLLSHRTKNADSSAAFRRLRARWLTWEEVRDAPVDEVERELAGTTWPEQKAPRIQAVLRLIEPLHLDFLEEMSVEEAREWLERLPGVGPKTSAAVLSFSRLRRRAMPVDSHHYRVAKRLGLLKRENVGASHAVLEGQLPSSWDAQDVYDHHEVMMFHGKRCCFPIHPDCHRCILLDLCPTGRANSATRPGLAKSKTQRQRKGEQMANVVGMFDDHDAAQNAISMLNNAGFGNDRISVIAADAEGHFQRSRVDDDGNMAIEGAMSGLTSGAVVGGLLGVLVGMGAIFVPGGVLLAGPIAGLVTGAAAGAATGGLLGGLIGLGIPREHADVYAEGVRRGGVLVSVDAAGRENEAENLLRGAGAVNVEERGAQYRQEGWTTYNPSAAPYSPDQIRQERDRYRPQSVDTTSVGQDRMVGLSAPTSIPGSSGIGISGGSLTDTSTGLGLGSVGTGSPGVPSTMSGNPAQGADTGSIGASTSDAGVTGDLVPQTEYANTGEAHNFTDRGGPFQPQGTAIGDGSAGHFPTRDDQDESDIIGRVDMPNATGHTDATPYNIGHSAGFGALSDGVNTDPTSHGSGTDTQTWVDYDYEPDFNRDFQGRGLNFQQVKPAYEYGQHARQDPRFAARSWDQVELELRDDWERRQPGTWSTYRDAVRRAWEMNAPSGRAELL